MMWSSPVVVFFFFLLNTCNRNIVSPCFKAYRQILVRFHHSVLCARHTENLPQKTQSLKTQRSRNMVLIRSA